MSCIHVTFVMLSLLLSGKSKGLFRGRKKKKSASPVPTNDNATSNGVAVDKVPARVDVAMFACYTCVHAHYTTLYMYT